MKKQLIEIFITYRNDYMGKNTTTVKLIFGKYFFMAPRDRGRPYLFRGVKASTIFSCLLFSRALYFFSGGITAEIYGNVNRFNILQVF